MTVGGIGNDAAAVTVARQVAATGEWRSPEGERLPAGEVHAWRPGTNQTECGLPLHRAQLIRFAGVAWSDVQPASGGAADAVSSVCPRCAAALGVRRDAQTWQRVHPRP